MRFLYDALDFLPEVIQRPAIAFAFIILGYLLAKISIAALGAIFPEGQVSNSIETEDILPLRSRILRSGFWIIWFVSFIIGYSQLPLIRSSFNNFSSGIGSPANQAFTFLGSGVMMTLEPRFKNLKKFVRSYFASRTLPKLNGGVRFMLRLIWIPIFAISGLALNNPESTALKITATFLVLLLGYLLASVFKAVIVSVMGLRSGESHPTPKFLFYFLCSIFCVIAMGIWT